MSLFAPVSDDSWRLVAGEIEDTRLPAGGYLIHQGDPADALYVLRRGSLLAIVRDEDGGEQVVNEIGPGQVIGEVAVISGGLRTVSLRAREEAAVTALSKQGFELLLEQHPVLFQILRGVASRRLRRSQLAAFLRPFLGDVGLDFLREIEPEVEWLTLRSGETLFQQGDDSDAAYGVVTGRLRLTVDDGRGGERMIGEVGRGEVIGETALLSGLTRSFTARAVRDSDLARFSRPFFEGLVESHPKMVYHVARLVGQRMEQQVRAAQSPMLRTWTTFAIVPARPAVAVSDFTSRLARSLAVHRETQVLTSRLVDDSLGKSGVSQVSERDPAEIQVLQWLNERESQSELVIYEADREWSGWSERCARQADHVLIVADAEDSPVPGEVETRLQQLWTEDWAPRVSLVLLYRSRAVPRHTTSWLEHRNVDRHHHVALDSSRDFDRLARILTGNAVGLVLGGGGARGFAHIGVFRAFDELGIPIDLIGGTSMGAVIAATRADGYSWEESLEGARRHSISVIDPTLPLVSLLSGRKMARGVRSAYRDLLIEDLDLPYFTVSSNLTRAATTVHYRGSLFEAIRCSLSLPGIFPPTWKDGDLHVDGGILDNVPVGVMHRFSDGCRVVAVDVSPEVDLSTYEPFESVVSGWRVAVESVLPFGKKRPIPRIHNTLMRSTLLASIDARKRSSVRQQASLYLEPDLQGWGLLDFKALDQIAEAGYRSTLESIRSWWQQLQEQPTADTPKEALP